MFNISFKVGDHRLAETLTQLKSIARAVEVSYLGSASDQPAQTQASTLNGPNKPRRNYRRRNQQGPNDTQKATAVIRQQGSGPFKVAGLIAECGKIGISAPSVYRALRLGQDAGHVRRLEAGLYQLA